MKYLKKESELVIYQKNGSESPKSISSPKRNSGSASALCLGLAALCLAGPAATSYSGPGASRTTAPPGRRPSLRQDFDPQKIPKTQNQKKTKHTQMAMGFSKSEKSWLAPSERDRFNPSTKIGSLWVVNSPIPTKMGSPLTV